jgi:broad specificity phosphatase PhoE
VRFTFIRHGQPEWFTDGRAVDNPSLTAVGRRQAQLTADRLAGPTASRLLVSPLQRAVETAEPIAEALGLEPEVSPWLAEISSPPWHGAPLDHVQQVFAEHRDKPIDDHWEGLEGGEAFHRFHRRVTHGLQEFLDAAGKQRVDERPALWTRAASDTHVVCVAHGGTDASAIGYLLGIDPVPWEWERFITFHSSVSEVIPTEISGRHAYSLLRLSDVSHLPPGLQTR